MALQDELDAFRAKFAKMVPQDVRDQLHEANEDLRDTGILNRVVNIGDILPDFALPNQDGETVQLADLRARGPVIISYFRGNWCPYCLIELEALSRAYGDVRAMGAELVVISPQLPRFSAKIKADKALPFDLLTDEGLAYADQLNLTFMVPENVAAIYKQFGVNVAEHNGDAQLRLPMPARLAVNSDGKLLYAATDPDYTRRPDPAETLAVLRQRLAA